jgi:hypothetical protein
MLRPVVGVRHASLRTCSLIGEFGACCAALLGVAFGFYARPVAANEGKVVATTDAQFYSFGGPFGGEIRRRRFTQTLSLSVADLWRVGADAPSESGASRPSMSLFARLRLDSDFGQFESESDPNQLDRFVPGLEPSPLDLSYLYLEGRGYLGGYVGFRAGRQYLIDPLGFWSFDGAQVWLDTPIYLRGSAYAGFEQRGGLPLSSSRFESGGVYRGDRTGLELVEWPAYLKESALAPAFGFGLETTGLAWLSSRLSYRRVTNQDRVVVSPFADAGLGLYTVGGARVSSERVGYSLWLGDADIASIRGDAVYDAYAQLVSEYALGVEVPLGRALRASANYDYYYPTFDGDSIFNWFAHTGSSTALGRAEWSPRRRLDFAASGGARFQRTEGDPASYAAGQPNRNESATEVAALFGVDAVNGWTDGSIASHSTGELAPSADWLGTDLTLRQSFDGGRYDALVVTSVHDFRSRAQPDRAATSFGYVLGGGFSPRETFWASSRLGLEWEHEMNRLVGQRFRVLATLKVTVLP